MILTFKYKHNPGEIIKVISLLPTIEEIDPPQPVLILRESTREEHWNYWMANEPIKFQEALKIYGPIPQYQLFYEVSLD